MENAKRTRKIEQAIINGKEFKIYKGAPCIAYRFFPRFNRARIVQMNGNIVTVREVLIGDLKGGFKKSDWKTACIDALESKLRDTLLEEIQMMHRCAID